MMRKTIYLGCLVSLLTLSRVYAMDIVPANSADYYQFGGGGDVSMPPVTEQTNVRIGGDVKTNLDFTCNGFNPSISISNTLKDIDDSLQGIQQDVINSATGAVGSMPMYLLSKSNKDLYNLIENTMTSATDMFHLSMKSCQDALNDIHDGKSPYQDWFAVSDSQGWLKRAHQAAQGQDVDINHVNQDLAQDPEQMGVPWVHENSSGNSGGTSGDQVPIKVIEDVVIAGYNATVDPNAALDSKTTQAPSTTALARYWPTAADAGAWGKLVLGDITISAREDEDDTARGVGLMTLIQTCPEGADKGTARTCARAIATDLATIVSQPGYPEGEALVGVSSNELLATPTLIDAIRNHPREEQSLEISKWSQDVAIQNVVDEALALRRLLIAGSQTKPVHNLKPALNTVNQVIMELNNDIKNILFQYQVRQTLMTHTAQSIIGDQVAKEVTGASQQSKTQQSVMENGAVYVNQSEEGH